VFHFWGLYRRRYEMSAVELTFKKVAMEMHRCVPFELFRGM